MERRALLTGALRLEPGMVFTDEPGIFALEKFGVRIGDCVRWESGVAVLSARAATR
jgi:Xaa-Pro aminopeptidase